MFHEQGENSARIQTKTAFTPRGAFWLVGWLVYIFRSYTFHTIVTIHDHKYLCFQCTIPVSGACYGSLPTRPGYIKQSFPYTWVSLLPVLSVAIFLCFFTIFQFSNFNDYIFCSSDGIFFSSLAFPSALTLGTQGDLPGIVTWRAFTTSGTGAPITGPPQCPIPLSVQPSWEGFTEQAALIGL